MPALSINFATNNDYLEAVDGLARDGGYVNEMFNGDKATFAENRLLDILVKLIISNKRSVLETDLSNSRTDGYNTIDSEVDVISSSISVESA